MSELRYGRYFVLEVQIVNLFSWLEDNMKSDWSVEIKGVCPLRKNLILVGLFSVKKDLACFDTEFLKKQLNNSPIYEDRRSIVFDWPARKERRGGIERRQFNQKSIDFEANQRCH